MKRNMLRNRTNISLLLLLTYLLTFFLASLHYHTFDFSLQDAIESQKDSASNHFLIWENNSYDCIILIHLANIHKTIITPSYKQTNEYVRPYFVLIPSIQIHVISGYSKSDNLRAPPKLV